MKDINNQSRCLWDELAADWDKRMGDESNSFHREIIRPSTLKLLNPQKGEHVLDVACGNGNFSRYLAELGVQVTAFDYSAELIKYAKERSKDNADLINYQVADATKYAELIGLQRDKPFDKAVSNMAVMDISDIHPLLQAIYEMLPSGGIFVFSGIHPCFQTPNMRKITVVNDYSGERELLTGIQTYEYIAPKLHETYVLANNSKKAYHFHRPLSMILNDCFTVGFVLDGIEEPVFQKPDNIREFDWYDIPPAIVLRMRKA